jgi:hypothetical protein
MNIDFIQVHDYPNHDLHKDALRDHAFRLQRIFPDCSRHIMVKGWRSPIGDWKRGSTACPDLKALKDFVHDLLPGPEWDFFTWFEVLEPGGTVGIMKHFEHQWVARYMIEGFGSMTFNLGKRTETIAVVPGQIVISPGIADASIPDAVQERRIAVVVNANMVFKVSA